MTSSSSSSPEIQPAPTADAQERFTYKHATHEEVLEDLSSRFLLNLPDEELSSLERICFQVEQAHWFYEDFVREENPKFPSLPLKKFSEMLFHACPLLHQWSHDHEQAFNTFMQYKTRVPVCGAIMLNETWEKCILVKGWKSSSGWGFPKGKINEHEPSHECAIREVLEETGYNLAGQINPSNVIEMSIKEQLISLFIVAGIPEDFPFKTRTRKEISRIEWFRLTDLPTWRRNKAAPGKFYLISPFIAALKAFITARKPRTFESRNRESVSCISGDRGALESSSSSADTREPQTPSPQYSEAIPVINDRMARRESDEEKIVPAEPLDPHFARLLNSLSISASKKTDMKPPHAANMVAPVSPSNRIQTPDWSSRVPPFSEIPINSPGSKHTFTRDSQYREKHFVHASEGQAVFRAGNGAAEPLPFTSSSSATSGARKPLMSSRRSSSIADISPYLSRPAEVPTSGRKLKQLALLESVADESCKMTPTLVGRELPLTLDSSHRPAGYPGLCSSVPRSHDSVSLTRGENLSPLHPYHEGPTSEDLFNVRPRSSQFNHPTTTYMGGVSARQNHGMAQLGLPLTNIAQSTPPFPPAYAPSYSTSPLHSFPPHAIYPYSNTSNHAMLSIPPHSFVVARDAHAVSAMHPQTRTSVPSSSIQLLSILNGERASEGHAPGAGSGRPSTRISVHAT